MRNSSTFDFVLIIIGSVIILFTIGIFSFKREEKAPTIDYPIIEADESVTTAIKDIDELDEDTKKKCLEFLKKCEDNGLPVRVIETYRSQKRQDFLYQKGRTTTGPKVTWTRNSMHTKRRAFDIAKKGSNPFGDDDFFRKCADIGKSVGLEAGYYWKVKDSGHFQNNISLFKK